MIQIRLRLLMTAHRIGPTALARETGISRATIYRILDDKAAGIQFETLAALCRRFGVGVGALLEYAPDEALG